MKLRMIATTFVLSFTVSARATTQIPDVVTYKCVRCLTYDGGLELIWGRQRPEFDVSTTANRKRYTSEWAVHEGKLWLVKFEAKRDHKSVPFSEIIPGRTLPTVADWHSGRMYLASGKVVSSWRGADFSEMMFERVIILQVKAGEIQSAEEYSSESMESIWEKEKTAKKLVGSKNKTAINK